MRPIDIMNIVAFCWVGYLGAIVYAGEEDCGRYAEERRLKEEQLVKEAAKKRLKGERLVVAKLT